MQVIFADRAHHDFPGVYADPHPQRRIALCPERVCIPAHLVLHAQRRIERPLGMILVCNGCPEQRKDAVPQRLRNVAFVPVDSLHHELQRGVNNCAGFFRDQVLR